MYDNQLTAVKIAAGNADRFSYDVTNTMYTTAQSAGYTRGAQNTRNERDNVFSHGFATKLATVFGSVSAGYTLTHTIIVSA